MAVSLTSPQQVDNFPVYGEVTGKRVQWILGITAYVPAVVKGKGKVSMPCLTIAMQAGTRFTYPGGMEGWVYLVDNSNNIISQWPAKVAEFNSMGLRVEE